MTENHRLQVFVVASNSMAFCTVEANALLWFTHHKAFAASFSAVSFLVITLLAFAVDELHTYKRPLVTVFIQLYRLFFSLVITVAAELNWTKPGHHHLVALVIMVAGSFFCRWLIYTLYRNNIERQMDHELKAMLAGHRHHQEES